MKVTFCNIDSVERIDANRSQKSGQNDANQDQNRRKDANWG